LHIEVCAASCGELPAIASGKTCQDNSVPDWPRAGLRVSETVAPLLDAIRARGFRPETMAADKGYDNSRVYAECEERDVEPVIPLRGVKVSSQSCPSALAGVCSRASPATRSSSAISTVGRAAVEREFAYLKTNYYLTPLRLRGLAKVQLRADLTIIARLGQALSRTRAVPLAA
jgi:Transposase DDE domain